MPAVLPTPPSARLAPIDGLRGMALLGILLVNLLYWSGWVVMTPAQQVAHAGEAMRASHGLVERLLLDGKFYTLFSLLFGIGCTLQLRRLQAAGNDGVRLFRRRMAVLLAIGLVHTLLIWDGDILVLYALLGFLLPAFTRLPDHALLKWAVLLVFVLPLAGPVLFGLGELDPGGWLMDASLAMFAAKGGNATPDQLVAWLQQADWGDQLVWSSTGTLYSWGLRLESWRIPKVLGIMVLGVWAGRRIAQGGLLQDARWLKRVLAGGLLIGLPASLPYALDHQANQAHWSSVVGTVPLALAYAAAFLLAWARLQPLTGWLVAPGRMPLSNYLAQSVVNGLVFYGIGLGLVGRVPLPAVYAYGVALFAVQVTWSNRWLARHAQGPMEALWRRLTYPAGAAATQLAN